MDAYLAVASKRDQREYAERPVPTDAVRRILDAGRIAGSAKNRQPWRFLVQPSAESAPSKGREQGLEADRSGPREG